MNPSPCRVFAPGGFVPRNAVTGSEEENSREVDLTGRQSEVASAGRSTYITNTHGLSSAHRIPVPIMDRVFAILLSFATAVHTVFGCCGLQSHAGLTSGEEAPHHLGAVCSCALHGDVHDNAEPIVDSPASEGEGGAGTLADQSPGGRPARDHECHGTKCLSVLKEKTPVLEETASASFADLIPAVVVVEGRPHFATTALGEHLRFHAPARPIRAHLLLQVLLI